MICDSRRGVSRECIDYLLRCVAVVATFDSRLNIQHDVCLVASAKRLTHVRIKSASFTKKNNLFILLESTLSL